MGMFEVVLDHRSVAADHASGAQDANSSVRLAPRSEAR